MSHDLRLDVTLYCCSKSKLEKTNRAIPESKLNASGPVKPTTSVSLSPKPQRPCSRPYTRVRELTAQLSPHHEDVVGLKEAQVPKGEVKAASGNQRLVYIIVLPPILA